MIGSLVPATRRSVSFDQAIAVLHAKRDETQSPLLRDVYEMAMEGIAFFSQHVEQCQTEAEEEEGEEVETGDDVQHPRAPRGPTQDDDDMFG